MLKSTAELGSLRPESMFMATTGMASWWGSSASSSTNMGRMKLLAGGVLKMWLVKAEVANAESFSPRLDHFIIATTAKADAKVKKQILSLDQERRAKGQLSVTPWFWEYYNGWLNNDARLQEWYYRDVLHTRHPETTDRYILDTFHMAFSRNAFRDPIGAKSRSRSSKRLKTLATLATGELRDRETKAVIRKAPGGLGLLSSREWREKVKLVSKAVDAVRDCYRDARDSKPPGLIEHSCQVEIRDGRMGTPRSPEAMLSNCSMSL